MEIRPKTLFRLQVMFILLVFVVMLFLVQHASNQQHFTASNQQWQELPADSLPTKKPHKQDTIRSPKVNEAIEKEKKERIKKEMDCKEYARKGKEKFLSQTEFDAHYAHKNINKMLAQCQKYCKTCDLEKLKFDFFRRRLQPKNYVWFRACHKAL